MSLDKMSAEKTLTKPARKDTTTGADSSHSSPP